MPVTVVPRSLATDWIDTFMTELSRVMRNWADARMRRTGDRPPDGCVVPPAVVPPAAVMPDSCPLTWENVARRCARPPDPALACWHAREWEVGRRRTPPVERL